MTIDKLRLRDYRPRSMLRVPVHDVRRPRFPVVDEAAGLGATTWLIARDAAEAGSIGGEVSLIGGGLHALARLPLLVHPAHALALSLALTRGRDPDAPRHLGQVVILDP